MSNLVIYLFLSFLILAITSLLVILFIKYRKLKKYITSYKELNTNRYGFYIYANSSSYYKSIVYVTELDRYKNGYSKIKIHYIEPFNNNYQKDSIKNATENFMSLKLTKEIEWLESEDHLKQLRKEKLEILSKL